MCTGFYHYSFKCTRKANISEKYHSRARLSGQIIETLEVEEKSMRDFQLSRDKSDNVAFLLLGINCMTNQEHKKNEVFLRLVE